MSLGDTIRNLLDPPATRPPAHGEPSSEAPPPGTTSPSRSIDPIVSSWLANELPRLRDAGLLRPEQAVAIARHYGVVLRVQAADGAPAPIVKEASVASGAPPERGTAPSLAPFLSEHGVSLVLYLGAFLIVAAVIVFLAYNWGQVGGTTRLGAVLGLTVGFLAAAAICLRRPSVRLAGRTFLALGAILVPANVAAAYQFVFAGGPVPEATFWLLGALSSGALWAALSLRLQSRIYGGLAALTPAVAAVSVASLVAVPATSYPTVVVTALALMLIVGGFGGERPLARVARLISAGLLPIVATVAIVGVGELPATIGWPDTQRWAVSVSLFIMMLALAREASQPGGLWGAGPIAGLAVALAGSTAYLDISEPLLPLTLAGLGWVSVAVARRLGPRPSLAWDQAAGVLALAPALTTWDERLLSGGLFALATVLCATISRARRSAVAAYVAVLAADLAYVKAVTHFGSPNSPDWGLGLALWPLALGWWGAATLGPRRLAGPFWAAALATGGAAALLAAERPELSALMAASFAATSGAAAWRSGQPLTLVWVGPWLMLGAYQTTAWIGLDTPARLAASGVTAWALVPLFSRQGIRRPRPDDAGEVTRVPMPTGSRAAAELIAASVGPVRTDWAAMARATAAGIAGLSATLLLIGWTDGDTWLVANALGWANLATILTMVAAVTRSGAWALAASLVFAVAMLAGIERLHPTDAQAVALPIGLYLLGVSYLARRAATPERRGLASALTALGVAALLVPGLAQSLDRRLAGHALWTATEGLLLAGWGIATRWKPLAAGGVAAIVVIALRQLFDAVNALPSWLLLGGTGLVLLAAAVVLLQVRERVLTAGRVISDRWNAWD